MVVDEGFDLSVAELQGRVAAAYTETCIDTSTSGSSGGTGATSDAGVALSGPAFDALKKQVIAELSRPDNSCQLSPGISAKSDPMATVAQYKSRWNAMVLANQYPNDVFAQAEYAALTAAFKAEFDTFAYHGTATAGTVAHDNPNVRLVLIERKLSSESALKTQFTCLAQSDIDLFVALLSDADVFKAFANQPATIDGELASVTTKYNVGLVNESFGSMARATLEAMQTQSGCPTPIALSAYFTLYDKVELAHAATIAGPALLTVQAAGNESAEIDSGADALACDIGDPQSLLVGSYDLSQVRSSFTNFGACVDIYAPGEAIVAPYAGGWLLPVAGTSFASPMVVRYLSLTAANPFNPGQAKSTLLDLRASDGSLPITLFPNDFFYRPIQAHRPAGKAAVLASVRPPSRFDMVRAVRPLSRLRAVLQQINLR
jgi:subtilisin family serine protease